MKAPSTKTHIPERIADAFEGIRSEEF